MEAFTVGDIEEVIVVWIPGRFGEVVLEVVKPVAVIISGTGRCFDPDLLVSIIQKAKEAYLAVGRCRQIGILHRAKYRPLGK